ncbi:hypothetical protein [Adhaeretor mobilis]|nr:hypothetical protein [Adhaeretor mobilis]
MSRSILERVPPDPMQYIESAEKVIGSVRQPAHIHFWGMPLLAGSSPTP